jgi:hypothetical protein
LLLPLPLLLRHGAADHLTSVRTTRMKIYEAQQVVAQRLRGGTEKDYTYLKSVGRGPFMLETRWNTNHCLVQSSYSFFEVVAACAPQCPAFCKTH